MVNVFFNLSSVNYPQLITFIICPCSFTCLVHSLIVAKLVCRVVYPRFTLVARLLQQLRLRTARSQDLGFFPQKKTKKTSSIIVLNLTCQSNLRMRVIFVQSNAVKGVFNKTNAASADGHVIRSSEVDLCSNPPAIGDSQPYSSCLILISYTRHLKVLALNTIVYK